MPPRKKKKSRRRDTAISVTGLAEAVMLANVGTKAAFNLSAYEFITDGWGQGSSSATGYGQISLYEMIYGNTVRMAALPSAGGSGYTTGLSAQSNTDVVISNLQNNWMPALVQSVAIPVGFRVGKRLLRKPISMGNKLLKQAGLRSMVKI